MMIFSYANNFSQLSYLKTSLIRLIDYLLDYIQMQTNLMHRKMKVLTIFGQRFDRIDRTHYREQYLGDYRFGFSLYKFSIRAFLICNGPAWIQLCCDVCNGNIRHLFLPNVEVKKSGSILLRRINQVNIWSDLIKNKYIESLKFQFFLQKTVKQVIIQQF